MHFTCLTSMQLHTQTTARNHSKVDRGAFLFSTSQDHNCLVSEDSSASWTAVIGHLKQKKATKVTGRGIKKDNHN